MIFTGIFRGCSGEFFRLKRKDHQDLSFYGLISFEILNDTRAIDPKIKVF